jgi:NAD(P)-dependent dehydrogenase (short-subunit alcohol dehydrogenase family)
MIDLSGKVIIVTGGFGALGNAVAAASKAAGAAVAIVDRSASPAHGLALHKDVLTIGGIDLTNFSEAETCLKLVATTLKRIDGIVNVAGGFRWGRVDDTSIDTWDLLFSLNLKTALNATRAALPFLLQQERGRIVNIGAAASAKAGVGMGPYAASKAAVAKLTEALAEELKDRQITVNAILPSVIDTEANRADMPDADSSRWIQPIQIADIIIFLLSDAAQAITGALIPVTGRS